MLAVTTGQACWNFEIPSLNVASEEGTDAIIKLWVFWVYPIRHCGNKVIKGFLPRETNIIRYHQMKKSQGREKGHL